MPKKRERGKKKNRARGKTIIKKKTVVEKTIEEEEVEIKKKGTSGTGPRLAS